MIILHMHFAEGAFHLWAEASESLCPAEAPDPATHPYAAPADVLKASLQKGSFHPALDASAEVEAVQTLCLPQAEGVPLPSSPLLGYVSTAERTHGLELGTFRVPVLTLSSQALQALLRERVENTLWCPGVMLGADVAFWAQCGRVAQYLVVLERFYPDFIPAEARAVWRAALSGAEALLFSELLERMPPVCVNQTDTPPGEALRGALDAMVDARVRSAFAPSPTTPRDSATPHDCWLAGLETADGRLSLLHHEGKQLRKGLRLWQAALAGTTAPYRLCFRLEEPMLDEGCEEFSPDAAQTLQGRKALLQTADTPWTLRYLLQSVADPSLLIPVEDLWQPGHPAHEWLRQQCPDLNLREHLLLSLGQACRMVPAMEASLLAPRPWGLLLETDEVFRFLSQTALTLEQGGFGVLLPAWWNPRNKRQRLSLFARTRSPQRASGFGASGMIGAEEILSFEWQAALGDQPLTRQELDVLSQAKTPLVRLRNQWVSVDAQEIRDVMAFWQKHESGRASVRDLLRMSLGAGVCDPLPVPFGGVQAEGWFQDLLNRFHGNEGFEERPVPVGFTGQLRPYQQRGYSWMAFLRQWGLGACLADDMGLGKTVQTLALIQADRVASPQPKPVLLVCPTSVLHNWFKEAAKFTPDLPVYVHHGAQRLKGKAFLSKAKRHGVVVTSYALLHRDASMLQSVAWSGIILDEAQNIKNAETRQSQAARTLKADYRIALTGTPVENNVGDLWALMDFLNPGFLGSQRHFREQFFIPIQFYQDEEASARLKGLTQPFLLRRLKTDKTIIADLPEKQESVAYCRLSPEQVTLYQAVVRDMEQRLEEADGMERRGLILGALSKLKQVCNHPAHFLGETSGGAQALGLKRSGKLERLAELVSMILAQDERALIFTQFAEMGRLLQPFLQETFGREVLFLHGGVSKPQRDAMVERFQNETGRKAPPLFLLSLKAGGTGLTLTRANHVIHFDRWWNPAVENQATDRAFRIGQTRNVQVSKFVCEGTLEEKIDAMITEKSRVAGTIVGSGEGWLTELSTGELKNLFALSRDIAPDADDRDDTPRPRGGARRQEVFA